MSARNITDEALQLFRGTYGGQISKNDICDYVNGLLHSSEYRETYAADLKKMLPRIPLVTGAQPFIDAGRRLSELHLGYESVEPYPLEGMEQATAPKGDAGYSFYRAEKMRFGKPTPEHKATGERHHRSTVVYNSHITLRGIPDNAHRYMLGSRSALEWILDRYQIKTDKAIRHRQRSERLVHGVYGHDHGGEHGHSHDAQAGGAGFGRPCPGPSVVTRMTPPTRSTMRWKPTAPAAAPW